MYDSDECKIERVVCMNAVCQSFALPSLFLSFLLALSFLDGSWLVGTHRHGRTALGAGPPLGSPARGAMCPHVLARAPRRSSSHVLRPTAVTCTCTCAETCLFHMCLPFSHTYFIHVGVQNRWFITCYINVISQVHVISITGVDKNRTQRYTIICSEMWTRIERTGSQSFAARCGQE
jgi:hypothetical protein